MRYSPDPHGDEGLRHQLEEARARITELTVSTRKREAEQEERVALLRLAVERLSYSVADAQRRLDELWTLIADIENPPEPAED